MKFEKMTNANTESAGTVYSERGATEFECILGKCYAYASTPHDALTDEYSVIYKKVINAIEHIDCTENVRAVLRLRYRHGHKFVDVSRILGISYQWAYELHKIGVGLLEKHLLL